MTTDNTERDVERTAVDRRSVMKAVGATTIGLAGLAGTAGATTTNSAPRYNFYGCSQVCVDRKCDAKAVFWNGERLCEAPIEYRSHRNDPPVREWYKVYCYAVENGEAIVGIEYDGTFIENPNRCAQNYPNPNSYE